MNIKVLFKSQLKLQFLASRLRFWKLSVLFSCLKLFAENPNWMQVLQQSYLFFSEDRK